MKRVPAWLDKALDAPDPMPTRCEAAVTSGGPGLVRQMEADADGERVGRTFIEKILRVCVTHLD